MKSLIAFALITISLGAHAAPYENAVARQGLCSEGIGTLGRISYLGKVTGEPKDKYIKMAAPLMNGLDEVNAARMRKMTQFAIDYGYDQATDAKDAHMKAWARCMDETR